MNRAASWLSRLFGGARPVPRPWVEPPRLSGELADLLAGTVGPDGLPGVLADWFDERCEHWAPLAAALREATPAPAEAESRFYLERYLVAADGVVAWLASYRVWPDSGDAPPAEFARLGFHRTTPGREAAYRLDLPADWPGLAALRGLFGPARAGE